MRVAAVVQPVDRDRVAREALGRVVEHFRSIGVTPAEGAEIGGLDADAEFSMYDHVRDALVEAHAPLRRLAPRRRALTELFEQQPGAKV